MTDAAPAPDTGASPVADTAAPQAAPEALTTEQAIAKAMNEPAPEPRNRSERPNGKPSPVENDDAAEPEAKPDKPKAEAKTEPKAGKPTDAPRPEAKDAPKAEAETAAPPKARVPAPERFNDLAKADWDKAPEQVQSEVVRMQRELEKGIADYKARVEPLRPFLEMAEKAGTKLESVLPQYVEVERALAADPVAAVARLAQNYVPGGLEAFVAMLTGQPQGQTDPRDAQIAQLTQQLQQLTQHIQQTGDEQRAAQEAAQLQAVIREISAQMPRFEELRPEMQRLVETGYVAGDDPRDVYLRAYALAERLIPVPMPQPEAAPPAPAPQTRVEATSITGAPRGGSDPRDGTPLSTDEAILKAMKRFRSA